MDRILLTEYNNKLYTPLGSLERYVMKKNLELGIEPTVEGLHDVVVRTVESKNEARSFADFEPVLDPTPADASVSFGKLGLTVDGGIRERWPIGFSAIFGSAGSGKTLMAPILARAIGAEVIRLGEPGAHTLPFSPQLHCKVMNDMLFGGSSKAYVVDSMRMSTLGGSRLGPGGIPRDMGFQLSQLDYACRLTGVTIFGVINLLTNDERAISSAYEVISSSCTAVMSIDSTSSTQHERTLSGTIMVRPEVRMRRSFSFNFSRKDWL